LPALEQPPPVGLGERLALVRQGPVLAALGVTTLAFVAGFTVYTYISPIVQDAAPVGGEGVSALLLVFGAAAVLGNALGGRGSDRHGPARTMAAGLIGMVIALAALGLLAAAAPDPPALALLLTALTVGLWAIAGWALAVPVEHRLIALAPKAPAIALALNASALYAGIALGGVVGGVALDSSSPAALGFIGAAVALLTVPLLAYSTRLATHTCGPRQRRKPAGCEPPCRGRASASSRSCSFRARR
ncbi:MAG: MFS transporter, partial [Thermoleophilaceae bacterium]